MLAIYISPSHTSGHNINLNCGRGELEDLLVERSC